MSQTNAATLADNRIRRRLITTAEAAVIIGVTEQEVRRLLRAQVIQGVKVGRTWRINYDALCEWLGLGVEG